MRKIIINILLVLLAVIGIWSSHYLEEYKIISNMSVGLIGIIALVKEDMVRKKKS